MLKDSCERCGRALPAGAPALSCVYDCTFCPECAQALRMRCPNCGGELVNRRGAATA